MSAASLPTDVARRWTRWSRLTQCLPFMVILGGVLFTDQTFVFRDSAHFYHPLFQWIDSEWRAGRVPLWNPLENTGVPTLADATSSVFYPGKILFFLPFSFGWRYKLFVAAHLALAQWGANRLARRWGASAAGAALAGIAYAYSGNVLFQHCNVVFLVGAAWLPWALAAGEQMLREKSLRAALMLGVILALMVLGGDPQAAYNAGLAVAIYSLQLWRADRSQRRESTNAAQREFVWRPVALLTLAAVVGGALAAIQILPAVKWAAQSSRAASEKPINIYSAVTQLHSPHNIAAGLLQSPTPGTHQRQIYEFSSGPWRLAEFVWPNFSGRMFPEDHRWLDILPAEDRVWCASHYLGLLPLLCGLVAWRVRSGELRDRWLAWLTLLATIGSFGWFGLGWLGDEIQFWFTGNPQRSLGIGQPVGGLYWLMVTLLPGYSLFRFPGKLLVIASLGLSVLASRGFDQLLHSPSTRFRQLLLWLGVGSLLAATITWLVQPTWQLWFDQQNNVATFHTSVYWYGPLVPSGATLDLLLAFTSTGLLSFLLRGLLTNITDANRARRALVLLAVTAAEITLANHWLVPLAPEKIVRSPPIVRTAMTHHESPQTVVPRVYRSPGIGTPAAWWSTSSPHRLVENYHWDHDTLFPKHHLPWTVAMVESLSTLPSQDVAIWLAICRQNLRSPQSPEQIDEQQLASWLSAEFLLLPPDARPRDATAIPLAEDAWIKNAVGLWRNSSPLPRAWLVHDITLAEPPLSNAIEERVGLTTAALFPQGKPRDLARSAVVEADAFQRAMLATDGASPPRNSDSADATKELCRMLRDSPQRIEIEAHLATPGLLVLNDLFCSGWQATVTTVGETQRRDVTILRTNRIMRGVWLPAGEHRVTFRYWPVEFYVGAAISTMAWFAVLVVVFAGYSGMRRNVK